MTAGKLRTFVTGTAAPADRRPVGASMMGEARPLLSRLIDTADWLPGGCAIPHEEFYRQYPLPCDPAERFSLVSFVGEPRQTTPIHDHTAGDRSKAAA